MANNIPSKLIVGVVSLAIFVTSIGWTVKIDRAKATSSDEQERIKNRLPSTFQTPQNTTKTRRAEKTTTTRAS